MTQAFDSRVKPATTACTHSAEREYISSIASRLRNISRLPHFICSSPCREHSPHLAACSRNTSPRHWRISAAAASVPHQFARAAPRSWSTCGRPEPPPPRCCRKRRTRRARPRRRRCSCATRSGSQGSAAILMNWRPPFIKIDWASRHDRVRSAGKKGKIGPVYSGLTAMELWAAELSDRKQSVKTQGCSRRRRSRMVRECVRSARAQGARARMKAEAADIFGLSAKAPLLVFGVDE